MEQLRRNKCPYVNFFPAAYEVKVPGSCFGLPADEVILYTFRLSPQLVVARQVTIQFPRTSFDTFEAFARALRKKYGQPEAVSSPKSGSQLVFWDRKDMTIRLQALANAKVATLDYVLKDIEKRIKEDQPVKKRPDRRHLESMV